MSLLDTPEIFRGLKLVESEMCEPVCNKVTLSHDVLVTDEFRKEFNIWLREFFGVETQMFIFENSLIAHPTVMKEVRRVIKEYETD